MTGRKWAYGFLAALVLVALLADFLANDRPLVAARDGKVTFPVLNGDSDTDWRTAPTDWAIWPPIRYRAGSTDLANGKYRPPLAAPRGGAARHWLGTDRLGRDTAAGLISGTRVAVIVGLGSVLVALLIGLPLGAVAGYFGNDRVRAPRYQLWTAVATPLLGGAYCLFVLWPATEDLATLPRLGAALLVLAVVGLVVYGLLAALAHWVSGLRRPVTVPLDGLVLQLIEITVSVPGLVLLIAVLAIVRQPSIWIVVAVVGFLAWTTPARFLRAELLRIRSLPYIEAARVSGIPPARILFRHALPNALGPVLVVAAFSVGLSILAESMLSFLGLGVPAEQVTWGSMLRLSRSQPSAWWLAVLPGLLLTLTVLACNAVAGARVR